MVGLVAQIKWLLAQNAISGNYKHQKINKKPHGQNHHMDDKKEGQKDAKPIGTKEGKELVLLMVGNHLIYSPSNVTYKQNHEI